ncbi:hypothetical protein DR64_5644 [Paraburkholderia xenovorans LB400]|jgi:hypothetical protein|nr:hypothetical protein DR64_5644 [Paraburkholderia xenovorans LB400]
MKRMHVHVSLENLGESTRFYRAIREKRAEEPNEQR